MVIDCDWFMNFVVLFHKKFYIESFCFKYGLIFIQIVMLFNFEFYMFFIHVCIFVNANNLYYRIKNKSTFDICNFNLTIMHFEI